MRRRVVTLIPAILTASTAAAAESSPLFENSDFEKGDLIHWTAKGSAFKSQRSKGDKLKAQGEFLIATDEESTGKLTSAEFKVTGDYLNFRIGGGAHANTSVGLQHDMGVARRREPGKDGGRRVAGDRRS